MSAVVPSVAMSFRLAPALTSVATASTLEPRAANISGVKPALDFADTLAFAPKSTRITSTWPSEADHINAV